MQLNKLPGRDLITSFWYKKLYFYRNKLTELYQSTYSGEEHLPPWLPQARTKLLAKNEITDVAKNYRPIACLNLMYKIYTSFLNTFLSDHCYKNQIISPEQAAGKKGVWGCTEQLLINKAIMTEVRKKRRNRFTIWLDYKKAFDSVPHEWLIYALKLAKVPPHLVSSIEHLLTQWCTVVHLDGENDSITSDIIQFMKGIFQGDSLSVLLFILTVNPLSFLLSNLKGHQYGTKRNSNVTHNFFVDDLKLYGNNINTTKKLLDLVTIFSKDTGMTFGENKCAYQQIEKGKLINNTKELQISDLKIKPIPEGDSYKYFGIDENISYVGLVNKTRVTKEYYTRVKRIWNSELTSVNKVIAHNSFAVPVLTTVGILNWRIDEIKEIDIKTRKHLTMSRNFYPNGDIDKLYLPRGQGGRGIKMIARMFESRIISIARPRELSKLFVKADLSAQKERYKSKVMHSYYERKIMDDPQTDKQLSNAWRKDKYLTSEVENYISVVQDQELPTNFLKNKRDRDSGKNPSCNNKCRLCINNVEDISHIVAGCSQMSARYYLPLRHDEVAKTVLNSHLKKFCPDKQIILSSDPEYIYKEHPREYWWNISIKTATKIPHNKPDLVIWNKETRLCSIIEFSCPLATNIGRKLNEKLETYGPLVRNLQILYPDYKYEVAPIIIGAMGYVPKNVINYLKMIGFDERESKTLTRKLQIKSISGTVNICKTFLSFSDPFNS